MQGVVTYEAWALTNPQGARRGAKTGFCFFDTTPWKLSLPHARQSGYYEQEWCGTQASMTNRVGVSVGWGDRYPWDFVFQWIDITGLPGGTYRVRATVDIQDYYRETDEFDNCVWTEVRIPAPGKGNAAHVLRNGRGCGEKASTAVSSYPSGTTFMPRDVTISAGVHVGWTFNAAGTRLRSQWKNLAAPAHRLGDGARHAAGPGRALALHGVRTVRRPLAPAGRRRPAGAVMPRLVGRDPDDLVVAAVRGRQEEPADRAP